MPHGPQGGAGGGTAPHRAQGAAAGPAGSHKHQQRAPLGLGGPGRPGHPAARWSGPTGDSQNKTKPHRSTAPAQRRHTRLNPSTRAPRRAPHAHTHPASTTSTSTISPGGQDIGQFSFCYELAVTLDGGGVKGAGGAGSVSRWRLINCTTGSISTSPSAPGSLCDRCALRFRAACVRFAVRRVRAVRAACACGVCVRACVRCVHNP